MELMDVNRLIPHPKNSYFFDDMDGQPWTAFLESVQTSGIIEPIVATQNLVIISGHQRVRAAKKLKIEKVPVEVRVIDSEDEILKQLIETNIRQRGIGNTNVVKLGLCIAELERIYGIKNGGDRKSERHNVALMSQGDLADELGITQKQLQRYKSLTDLIPELQDAVQTGQITATAAMGVVKKLSTEDQKQLAEQISGQEKVSGSEVKKYIDEIQSMKEENARLRNVISEQGVRNAKLQNELNQKVVEVKEVEVVPADYNTIKAKAREAESWKKDYQKEQMKVSEKNKEILSLHDQIEELKSQTAQATSSAKLIEGSIYFVAQCGSFVRDMGGYVWIADKISELPERERTDFMKAVRAIHDWAEVLQQNVERGM